MTVLPVLLEAVLKATLLLAAAGLVVVALRNATASLRHFVWSCSLVGALAIPALTLVLPKWQIGIVPAPGAEATISLLSPASDAPTVADRAVDPIDLVGMSTAPADVPKSTLQSQSFASRPPQDWPTIFVWCARRDFACILTLVGGLPRSDDWHASRGH